MRKSHPNLRRRTFFTPLLMPVLAGIALLATIAWIYANLSTTTVVLVRHAEKMASAGDDPGLTPAGIERARKLADLFEDADVDALFASQYRRTQATLEPLSRRIGVELQVVDAGQPAVLRERIFSQHRGQLVLVAGHSNTIPDLATRLSGLEVKPIDESDYTGIYILSLPRFGESRLVRLNYPD